MRVLIVSPSYFPEIGAAPSRITNMAEGLSGLGIEVDVLTCLPNYPKGRIFEEYRGTFSKKEDVNGGSQFMYRNLQYRFVLLNHSLRETYCFQCTD